ncbi:hypothetical protein PM082_014217 [Marasmius tenuissimus]|nr:hypothetical protein PM082_014217 [Marasmius tenuissimus]
MNNSDAMQEALRIEWAKSWARKRRWQEELALVDEEMHCVLMTLRYEAEVWRSRAVFSTDVEPAVVEGMCAYAEEQARICEELGSTFQALWARLDPPRPPPPPPPPKSTSTADGGDSDDNIPLLSGEGSGSNEEGVYSDSSN